MGVIKHGMRHHPLNGIYESMVNRCHRINVKCYPRYGGRGITVCDEWRNDRGKFFEWALANGWEQGLELDREKNHRGYSPDNCRFVTRQINANNKRNNIWVVIFGERLVLSEAVSRYSVTNSRTVRRRLHDGWGDEPAVLLPVFTKLSIQRKVILNKEIKLLCKN